MKTTTRQNDDLPPRRLSTSPRLHREPLFESSQQMRFDDGAAADRRAWLRPDEPPGGELVLRLVSYRYGRGAIMITTNAEQVRQPVSPTNCAKLTRMREMIAAQPLRVCQIAG